MKRSTKTISIIFVFFLLFSIVIVGRSMIGNHFKKKFSKRPPPGIIVTEVNEKEFSEQIETYGTAISKKSKTFKIKKDDLFEDLRLKNFVKKGEILIKLKNVLIPEINIGQLIKMIRAEYLVDAKGLNLVRGKPISSEDIQHTVKEMIG